MPRAQKHIYQTRYQLEKLRLEVALKRSRLAVIKKDIPRPYKPPQLDAEQTAQRDEGRAISKETENIYMRRNLSEARIKLARSRRELERGLEEEAYLKLQ